MEAKITNTIGLLELKVPVEVTDDYGNKFIQYKKEVTTKEVLLKMKQDLTLQLSVIDEKLKAIENVK